MTAQMSKVPLDELQFSSYWPPGSRELVRGFLKTKYDAQTMPPLHVAEKDGQYWLIGWQAPDGAPGLLEEARGWGLTQDEEELVRPSQDLDSLHFRERLAVMRRIGRKPRERES